MYSISISHFLLYMLLFCHLPANTARKDIYGDLIRYLKMYNDIDVGGLVVVDGQINDVAATNWFEYATLEKGDILTDNFFPVIYLRTGYELDIPKLYGALSRSRDASLIVIDSNFEDASILQRLIRNLSDDLLQDHFWLYTYPSSNMTENDIQKLPVYEELKKNPYLTLTSQVNRVKSHCNIHVVKYILNSSE